MSVNIDLVPNSTIICSDGCLTQWLLLHASACFCVCVVVLSPNSVAGARRCHSIYKGFAQCLMALGDSLTDNARKDEDTNEIHSICRSVTTYKHIVRYVLLLHKVALLSEGASYGTKSMA